MVSVDLSRSKLLPHWLNNMGTLSSNKDQGQHRISQVYLRQFGFRDKNNAAIISVLEVGNPVTQYKKIRSFTKETNLFDTTLADPNHSRYFENYSQKIETDYPDVINDLKINSLLSPSSRNQLVHFVANLFIRQSKTREYFLIPILEDKAIRTKLFNDITITSDNPNLTKLVLEEIAIDTEGSIQDKLNLIAIEIWRHLNIIFNQFTFVILKAQDGTGWFTSDNPVIVDTRDNVEAWIIPPQAEIYFPISPEYLLFMHNHRVISTNPLTLLPREIVTIATPEIQHEIMMNQISKSADKYHISCTDLGIVDVRQS